MHFRNSKSIIHALNNPYCTQRNRHLIVVSSGEIMKFSIWRFVYNVYHYHCAYLTNTITRITQQVFFKNYVWTYQNYFLNYKSPNPVSPHPDILDSWAPLYILLEMLAGIAQPLNKLRSGSKSPH